jgi:hypothetical protein
MTTFIAASRLACLATVLAAGIASIPVADIANAKSNSGNGGNTNGASPHSVISGQPANVKKVQSDHKDSHKDKKARKHAEKKKKDCEKITVPTPGCPINRKDPVGSVPPPAKKPVADAPAPHPSSITVSNGVTTYTLPYDPKFSVEVVKPGSITVHSGDRTVTLPGGSITVQGQAVSTSLAERAGLQEIINSRGDAVFAIKPAPQSQPPTQPVPTNGGSSGGGIVGGVIDAGKAIGNGIEDIGLGFINLGGPTPQPKTGTIIQE